MADGDYALVISIWGRFLAYARSISPIVLLHEYAGDQRIVKASLIPFKRSQPELCKFLLALAGKFLQFYPSSRRINSSLNLDSYYLDNSGECQSLLSG